jgi:hypothetical protein
MGAEKIWTVRSRRTCGGNPSSSGENTLGENECAGVETPEARRAEVNRGRQIQKDTCVDRLCISGGSTSGGSKCREFETPEARRAKVNRSRLNSG